MKLAEKLELENGLKVFIKSAPLHSVALSFAVRYGSVDEFNKPDTSGASHFLEHMLFKGTKNRTWAQIRKDDRDNGIMHNAETNFEQITYYMAAPASGLEPSASLLADTIKNSTIPEDELEKERCVIRNEVRSCLDDINNILRERFLKAAFKGLPPSVPIGGTLTSINKITRSRLLEIYKESHNANNSVLVAYGSLEPTKTKKILSEYFSDVKSGKKNKGVEFELPKPVYREKVIQHPSVSQDSGLVGFLLPGYQKLVSKNNLNNHAFYCLSRILDERLQDSIREERGLVYDIGTDIGVFTKFGFFVVGFGAEQKDSETVKSLIFEEIEKLRAGELSKNDLDAAKIYFEATAGRLLDSTIEFANLLAEEELTLGKEPDFELTKKVTVDDIAGVAQDYLDPNRALSLKVTSKQMR